MFELAIQKHVAFVVATHDERLAERTDRLLAIEDGQLAPIQLEPLG
jgi:predicted ABC-type transport system involved in lysophospholipase L1 biosynthesis ATPase subunit